MAIAQKPHVMKQEGGLRTMPGYTAVSLNTALPKVTVITVVFNSVAVIERTMLSIINQSYPNLEYIVVDGASTDGTIDVLWRYNEYIDYWISEADNGLYHAMNKALNHGTGQYVWFVNAGDEILGLETLMDVFRQGKPWADVYYGETMMVDAAGNELGLRRLKAPDKLSWQSLRYGMLVSHQAFIVSAQLAYLYDTQYRLSADYEWMLRVLKSAQTVVNTELILVRYLDGGMTKQNIRAGLKERFSVMRKHFGLVGTVLRHVYMSLRLGLFVARYRRF